MTDRPKRLRETATISRRASKYLKKDPVARAHVVVQSGSTTACLEIPQVQSDLTGFRSSMVAGSLAPHEDDTLYDGLIELQPQMMLAAYANSYLSSIDVDLGLEGELRLMTDFPPLFGSQETFPFAAEPLDQPLGQLAAQQIQFGIRSSPHEVTHESALTRTSSPTSSLVTTIPSISQPRLSPSFQSRSESDTQRDQAVDMIYQACMTTMPLATTTEFSMEIFRSWDIEP